MRRQIEHWKDADPADIPILNEAKWSTPSCSDTSLRHGAAVCGHADTGGSCPMHLSLSA
jgi:hypothetical protein